MLRSRARIAAYAALATAIVSPGVLGGQLVPDVASDSAPRRPAAARPRFDVGVGFSMIDPRGSFRRSARRNAGIGLRAAFPLGRWPAFALRLDGEYLQYRDGDQVPWSGWSGSGTRVVSHGVASLIAGPQLAVPDGPLRPYLHAGVGLAAFITSPRASDCGCDETVPEWATLESFDVARAFAFGGGLVMRLGRRPDGFQLDLGAQYQRNGEAQYVRRLSDAAGTLEVERGRANFMVYRVGASWRY